MLTNTTRDSSYSSARAHTRELFTSTPMTPLRTTSAPSTTRSAAYVSAWKPASPGQSMRLILRSCHSRWESVPESDIWRRCSSSSQSLTVVPCSIEPSRFVFPAWNSSTSTSEVLPTPRWPTTAMLRILPGSLAGMELLSSIGFRQIVTTTSELDRSARGGTGEPRLEAQDRLRVQLGDARLGDPEHLADLAQRQLFVVVEGDHELLALGKPRDRVGYRLA